MMIIRLLLSPIKWVIRKIFRLMTYEEMYTCEEPYNNPIVIKYLADGNSEAKLFLTQKFPESLRSRTYGDDDRRLSEDNTNGMLLNVYRTLVKDNFRGEMIIGLASICCLNPVFICACIDSVRFGIISAESLKSMINLKITIDGDTMWVLTRALTGTDTRDD
ncbi:MAG: hypothetical protein HQK96_12035 [Nitrospirae bacterium]|nr:hypothetical protein [Nitrospirota bacterium]